MRLNTETLIHAQTRRAQLVACVFGLGGFAWAGWAPLEGAVSASGLLVLENNVKKIQHPTGGVVGRIDAAEGMRVTAGDLLLRLDETATRASLAVIMNDLLANIARRARLITERDGLDHVDFPAEIEERAIAEPDLKIAMESERKVFDSRMKSRIGQKAQLGERIGQTRSEIEGLELQRTSTEIQLTVARSELAELKTLESKGLVPKTRLTTLEREIARNEGVLGETLARIAQSKGRITETQIQIDQVDRDKLAEVNKDLRETETKISELRERRVAAEDQLRRVDIRAPISGTVQQMTVHTVGGVVSPTDQLMVIVPEADQLVVEARVNPQDRDQLALDQPTRVRFTSFNQRLTPEVQATVFRISGDVIRDQQTQQPYYNVGVRVPVDELAKLNGAKLIAGMPAETYFKTNERTMLSYLLKPLIDHWQKSFSGR